MSLGHRPLRESLLQMGGLALDLARQTPTSSLTALARDKIADRLSLSDVPSSEEQDAVFRRFSTWLAGKSQEPTESDWELVPFVYLRGTPRIGADLRVAERVARVLRDETTPRALKRTIYVYLRDFGLADREVIALGQLIATALKRHTNIQWSGEWRARAQSPVELFNAEGLARRLAEHSVDQRLAPRELFRSMGMSTELMVHSGLHAPLAAELITATASTLAEGGGGFSDQLQTTLGFLREGDGLRFPQLRVQTADELLSPFSVAEPADSIRTELTEFFDRAYGDPRSMPQAWRGISDAAIGVMRRWSVRKSLDLFFDVLSKTADPIWKYRRSFWLALYRRGLIDDAWPAFGNTARGMIQGSQSLRNRIPSYGALRAAAAQQSVMLMRMRGFTVAEWSHSGACRIWSSDDPLAPAIGHSDYPAVELRETCLYAQNHTSAMSGGWQVELSDWIAHRTGVRISLRELMANAHA